ncbi:MAG: hypothetical protein LBG27_06490 [Spirochaetaceae bacterium]|nr:hypothetical protein [Spirochaetaceae bacterium]
MKRFLTLWLVLVPTVFFYSCGNPLLNLLGGDTGGGGGGEEAPPDTTMDDIPKAKTPIYIDNDDQLKALLSGPSDEYPADGYYILRGNGVPDRTFTVTRAAHSGTFTGTFTGWYKDDDTGDLLTKVKSNFGECLFTKMEGATVSWLKFETGKVVSTLGPTTAQPDPNVRYAGVVAALAKDTTFENVSVSGSVTINNPNASDLPTTVTNVYVGGIVGKADTGTEFENCAAGVSVTITTSNAGLNVYAGGIAGSLNGTVKGSSVEGKSPYGQSMPVTVSVTGGSTETCYAGGVAGVLASGVNSKVNIESTPVTASVTATGSSKAYAGGYFGKVGNGGTVGVYGLSTKVPLSVSLAVTAKTTSAGEAYAGGITGETGSALSNNRLSGSRSFITALSAGGTAYAGGIAGYSTETIADSSFSNSSGSVIAGFTLVSSSPVVVSKEAYAGGIAGHAEKEISTSYANVVYNASATNGQTQAGIDARVNASNGIAAAGGIAGKTGAAISQSYAVVTVKAHSVTGTGGTAPYGAIAGGIAGVAGGSIANTFALAQVDARVQSNSNHTPVYAGGIVGYLKDTFSVQKSYAAGSVLAHTFVTGGTVYAGGIAGYAAATSGNVVKACVALQRYIASNGTRFRVIGGNASSSTLSTNYAYDGMLSYEWGSPIIDTTNNDVDKTGGADISKSDATNSSTPTVSYTTTLGWTTEWDFSSSNSYPKLNGLDSPTFPSWVTLP